MRSALRHSSSASTTRVGLAERLEHPLARVRDDDPDRGQQLADLHRVSQVGGLPAGGVAEHLRRRARARISPGVRLAARAAARRPPRSAARRSARSTGRPSRASSTHSKAAADSEWAVATARAAGPGEQRLLPAGRSPGPRAAQASRRASSARPRRRAGIRAQVAVGAHAASRDLPALSSALSKSNRSPPRPRQPRRCRGRGRSPRRAGAGVPPADGPPGAPPRRPSSGRAVRGLPPEAGRRGRLPTTSTAVCDWPRPHPPARPAGRAGRRP